MAEASHSEPQGLKPAFLMTLGGTAEAVPFPRRFVGHVSRGKTIR